MTDRGVLAAPFGAEHIETAVPGKGIEARLREEAAAEGKSRKRLRLSVQAKITAPYTLLSLVLALAGAYVATRIIFETTRERFTNQLVETRKLASLWVSQEEDVLLEALRLLANTQGVGEAIRNDASERLREVIFPLALNAGIEAVEVVNLEGVGSLAMRHEAGGRIEDYEFSKGSPEYADWPIVRMVLQQYSDRSGDKFSAIVQASWGDYLYVSGPVFDGQGALAGVILVGESLATAVHEMRVATTGQIAIYDLKGQLLETTLMFEPDPVDRGDVATMISRQDTDTLARNHSLSDIVYEEMLGPLELREGHDEALLGTALPQNFLVAATTVTRVQVFSFAAVGFLLIILLGFAVSRTFTGPLHRLTLATSKVAEGDLNVKVSVGGDDEIAALADSFNRMLSAIKDSELELLEAHSEVVNAYDLTILGWARALGLRDEETEGHSRRVTEMTVRLARALGVDEEEIEHIKRGALLHDIGKMGIPDTILLKPGPLDENEWAEMRKHPVYSFEMLHAIDYLRPAIAIPYAHHERWDGAGYPRGLRGEEIPLAARVFAVVDVWDALSSDRPYREAWPHKDVITYMASCRGSHFDPVVLDMFFDILLDPENQPLRASPEMQETDDQDWKPLSPEFEEEGRHLESATEVQS